MLPTLTRSYPRHFTFYVAEPLSSICYFWTTIDPIGNVALFAGLTAALTRSERHLTALRAVFYATIILVVAVVAGQVIQWRGGSPASTNCKSNSRVTFPVLRTAQIVCIYAMYLSED